MLVHENDARILLIMSSGFAVGDMQASGKCVSTSNLLKQAQGEDSAIDLVRFSGAVSEALLRHAIQGCLVGINVLPKLQDARLSGHCAFR